MARRGGGTEHTGDRSGLTGDGDRAERDWDRAHKGAGPTIDWRPRFPASPITVRYAARRRENLEPPGQPDRGVPSARHYRSNGLSSGDGRREHTLRYARRQPSQHNAAALHNARYRICGRPRTLDREDSACSDSTGGTRSAVGTRAPTRGGTESPWHAVGTRAPTRWGTESPLGAMWEQGRRREGGPS